jgi:flagellar hook-associated protein FlgK
MTGSGFSTLNTARTGLSAAQRAMDVTGQNVVNANTPGYSRQRVVLASTGGSTGASFFSGKQAASGGVGVSDVTRIRDAFLEATRAAAGSRRSPPRRTPCRRSRTCSPSRATAVCRRR